jgi:hypothetical protein
MCGAFGSGSQQFIQRGEHCQQHANDDVSLLLQMTTNSIAAVLHFTNMPTIC